MAKGNNAGKKDQQKKKVTNPGQAPAVKVEKKPETKPAEKVEDAQEMTEEQMRVLAATDPGKLKQRMNTLSADSRILAFSLLEKTIVNPIDPALAFPLEVRKATNMLVAIGTLTTLMDHCANGDDTFAMLMQKTEYAALIECAKGAGYDIKLPEIKSLPVNEKGQVVIDAKKVKIGESEKKKLQAEQKIREGEKPELDPEKISSEEDLEKALKYMFVTNNRRITDILLEGIDFMKKFRMHEASLAENADEAKAKFENRTSGDWLDDLFGYVQPSVFFTGIGRGMANVTLVEKDPIHAFIIFRDAIKDKTTGMPILEDAEAAYCVKSIIKWYCNTHIDSNKKAIAELDPKKNASDIEKCNARIAELEKIIDYVTNPSADVVNELLNNIGSKWMSDGSTLTPECRHANTIFNTVCKSYYNEQLSTCDYKNLGENIQQYAGCIINLFRDPGSQIAIYKDANITKLEERSEEEKQKLTKEAKEAWANAKKAEKKESEKNA